MAPENLPEFPALAVMAVPGLEIMSGNDADGDPLGRAGERSRASAVRLQESKMKQELLKPESRSQKPDFKGSVVGIHFEVAGMHTGTLIRDLMATVERAELAVEQKRAVDARELYRIYALQIPATQADQILMGAA